MRSLFTDGARRPGVAFQGVLLAGIAVTVGTAAHATTFDESISGDLSSVASSPTRIGTLTTGSSAIVGASIPSGPIVDPQTGARAVEDNDYVSFNIPTGEVLSKLVLGSGSAFESGDRMFFGIARGVGVSVDPSFSSAAGLLGWTLVGNPEAGTDVLPALGRSAPANFPPIGGATGFSGPLGAGTYTLWLVDGDRPASYTLDLTVAAVPEPATWMTMLGGFGVVGGLLRRRGSRRPGW